MAGTIILDACFLIWLDAFERYCRENQERFGIPDKQMPLCGLNYLIRQGCHIVIPNEVLKEIALVENGHRVGIGRSPDGEPLLNKKYLAMSHTTIIRDWLLQHIDANDIELFTSDEAYIAAAAQAKIKGSVCIVALHPPAIGGGVEPKHLREPSVNGDTEIAGLLESLKKSVPMLPHTLTLTNDFALGKTIQQTGRAFKTAHSCAYLELLSMNGFEPNWQLPLDEYWELWASKTNHDNYSPNIVSRHTRNALNTFASAAALPSAGGYSR